MEVMEKPVSRPLPVQLTQQERIERAKEAARLSRKHRELDDERREAAKHFKERMDDVDSRMRHNLSVVSRGEELRDVECKWQFRFEENAKDLIRMDTGEVVETAGITADERQMLLQLNDQQKSNEAAKAAH